MPADSELTICVRPVALATRSRIMPNQWATGIPHPGFWPPGCPNKPGDTGVSGIEKLDPSTINMRWPNQQPVSKACFCMVCTHFYSSSWNTSSLFRILALQYAAALNANRVRWGMCAQAVFTD